MLDRRTRWLVLLTLAGVWAVAGRAAGPTREKAEKRKGTVVGTLATKGLTYIEVKADGEDRARRYVPRWVGGAPAQGGGFDKGMLAAIRKLAVGSRVRLEWEFEERPRVVRVEVLRKPKKE